MREVKYDDIQDGEIFLEYCSVYRKDISINRKLNRIERIQFITWRSIKVQGSYVLEMDASTHRPFTLRTFDEPNIKFFRLTDYEVLYVLQETI